SAVSAVNVRCWYGGTWRDCDGYSARVKPAPAAADRSAVNAPPSRFKQAGTAAIGAFHGTRAQATIDGKSRRWEKRVSGDLVTYTSENRIALITLNRPDKLNALSNGLVIELREAMKRLQASDDRVAILTGA